MTATPIRPETTAEEGVNLASRPHLEVDGDRPREGKAAVASRSNKDSPVDHNPAVAFRGVLGVSASMPDPFDPRPGRTGDVVKEPTELSLGPIPPQGISSGENRLEPPCIIFT